MIDDPDDAGVDGSFDGIERKARFFAADEKHFLADARADGISGHQRPSGRLAIGRQRLQDEKLETGEILVLARDDDVADDFGEMHYRFRVPGSGFKVLGS